MIAVMVWGVGLGMRGGRGSSHGFAVVAMRLPGGPGIVAAREELNIATGGCKRV